MKWATMRLLRQPTSCGTNLTPPAPPFAPACTCVPATDLFMKRLMQAEHAQHALSPIANGQRAGAGAGGAPRKVGAAQAGLLLPAFEPGSSAGGGPCPRAPEFTWSRARTHHHSCCPTMLTALPCAQRAPPCAGLHRNPPSLHALHAMPFPSTPFRRGHSWCAMCRMAL